MDPISQLGWRHRRGEVQGPASQLVRDVFVAADLVHLDAMSDVGGDSPMDEHCPESGEAPADGTVNHSPRRNTYPGPGVEVDDEGEHWMYWMKAHDLLPKICV